ncbi:hypothetical protein HK101_002160 [Irineochytrium annulatum]|nr:hypothetical protein HK101_002160 [Irineochytrium annulatum]
MTAKGTAVTTANLLALNNILKELKSHTDAIEMKVLQQKLGIKLKDTNVWRTCDKIGFDLKAKTIWYKHEYAIRSKEDLVETLKAGRDVGGKDPKELKESYPDVFAAIEELEKEGSILVVKDKNDAPKLVYYNCLVERGPNDAPPTYPSSEFVKHWNDVKVPPEEELLKELDKAGLKRADGSSTNVKLKVTAKTKSKRGRKGKTTNTHLGIDLSKEAKEWSKEKK